MAIGGETVGSAYVRILADGTGLDDDIADQFDRVDAEKMGREKGEDFGKGARSSLKKDQPKTQKAVNELFRADAKKIKALTKEMETTFFGNLERQVRSRLADNENLGDSVMQAIRKGFVTGGGYKQFGKDFQKLFDQLPGLEEAALKKMAQEQHQFDQEVIRSTRERENAVIAAGKRRGDAYTRMIEDAYRLNEKYDTQRDSHLGKERRRIEVLAKAESQAYQERDKRFEDAADRAVQSFERIRKGQVASGKSVRQDIDETVAHIRELGRELDRIPNLGGEDHDAIRRTLDDMDDGLIRINPRLRRFNGALDETSPRIGKLFGKGSRNDFVNFFGAGIEGITKMAFQLPKLGENLLGVYKQVRSGSTLFQALGKQFAGAGEAGASLSSSLAAGAVAIPIVVAVVGTLVAAVSLLLGVLVALASTIAFALVGALGVLAGSIAPVVAGIAVLVGAIASMSDAQKKALGQAIKPFTAEMKALGQVAAKRLFADAPEQAERLGGVFKGLRPLVGGVADAIREVGNGFLDALEGPGFKRFKDEMTKFLPGAVKSLGESFGNVIGGIGGLFVALIPATERFLEWLNRLTEKFADWANSAKGQNEIKNFMEDALESAKALGDFLGELGGLITDLLFNSEGKKTGDSLFESMAAGIKNFREYIADGGIEQWFKDAKKFGEDLGDVIKGIGEVLDTLDSPGFRQFASLLLKAFTEGAESAGNMLQPIIDLFDALDDLIHLDFGGFGKNLTEALGGALFAVFDGAMLGFGDEIKDKVTEIGGNVVQWFKDIDFSGIGSDIVNSIGSGISNAGGAIAGAVTSLFTSIGSIASSLASTIWNLPGVQMVTSLIGSIVSTFANLAGAIFELGLQIVLLIGRGVLQAGKDFAGLVGGVFKAAFEPIKTAAAPVVSYLNDKFSSAFGFVKGKASEFGGYISGAWSSLIGKGKSAASDFGGYLRDKLSGAMSGARGKASDFGGYISGKFSSAFSKAKGAIDAVKGILSDLKRFMDNAAAAARNLADKISKIKPPSLGSLAKSIIPGIKTGGIVDAFGLHRVKKMASGGIANFAQRYQIGEAGREAIVPLNRPLGQVDPAVRLLSAFAQGKLGSTSTSNDKSIDASGWVIQSPNDSETVAKEVLDALAAKIL